MNEIMPKRFEKFQTALDEKLKVNDAKIKRMVKDSSDKTSRSIKQNVDATDKLKKGLVTFQTMINQIRAELSKVKSNVGSGNIDNSPGARIDSEGTEGAKGVDRKNTAPLDVFNVDLGSSAGSANVEDAMSKSKEESEEDYMELYVQKELKDKIEPITEELKEFKDEYKVLEGRVTELES